jgi:GNAT superfamily N-acetyltransferase
MISCPLCLASSADSTAIATLFALSWTSPFMRLQLGHVDYATLITAMGSRIASQIQESSTLFSVIRDPATQKAVAVAQWTAPVEGQAAANEESRAEQDERQAFDDEAHRKRLLKNSNRDLVMEFNVGLRTLRQRVLQGRKHYLLENLATHPNYRGTGFASQLIGDVLPRADEEGVLVYLDTASDNSAMRMYKRLGFREEDSQH